MNSLLANLYLFITEDCVSENERDIQLSGIVEKLGHSWSDETEYYSKMLHLSFLRIAFGVFGGTSSK